MYKFYIAGYIGNLGTKILIDKKYNELSKYFGRDFLETQKTQLEKNILIDYRDYKSSFFLDTKIIDKEEIFKGGFLTALWKICDRNKWGIRYSLKDVPIMQITIEIANYFDLNPYKLLTNNSYIYVIDADLIDFVKFGELTNETKRVRVDNDVESFLTKDYKDEIDKVLPKYTKIKEKC